MTEFNSPIGKRQVPNSNLKQVDVPDAGTQTETRTYNFQSGALEDFQSRFQSSATPDFQQDLEAENSIRQAKEARRSGRERLSEGARKRIEMLIGMTRLTKEVEIDGQIYGLQTLKSAELREAMKATTPYDGTVEFIFETRKQLLARSITHVAGVELSSFLGSDELKDKLDFIEEIDHALLSRLYSEYSNLAKDSQNKYAIKTEMDAKEVGEDLKKS